MKRIALILLAVILLAASLSACSAKKNLDVFEFLAGKPTVGEVNDKIGKYDDSDSEFYTSSSYGDFYTKSVTYELNVCGIEGKLIGSSTTIGKTMSDASVTDSWHWIEDIPEDKVDSFKSNVTEYFNEKFGSYEESRNIGYDAYRWKSGESEIYLIFFDSDTLGITVEF